MKLPSPLRQIYMSTVLLVAPMMISLVIGKQFVPSPRWIEIAQVPATAIAITTTLAWFAIVSWQFLRQSQADNLRSKLVVIVGPISAGLCSWVGSITLIPIASAVLFGHPIELNYKVEMSDESGFRQCQTPITLQKMPFGFDQVCGASDALRQQIGPGSELILEGRGTEWGLFISSGRAAE